MHRIWRFCPECPVRREPLPARRRSAANAAPKVVFLLSRQTITLTPYSQRRCAVARAIPNRQQIAFHCAPSARAHTSLASSPSQLESSLAFRRLQLAYARNLVAFGKAGFNPAQPRVPAGHPDGGQWTRQGGAADAGPYRDVIRDTTGRQPWESYANLYRENGSLAEQAVVNRDGSAIRARFASSEAIGWDERYAVRTADGDVTTFQNAGPVQTIFDGEGRPVSRTAWTSNGQEAQAFISRPIWRPFLIPPPRRLARRLRSTPGCRAGTRPSRRPFSRFAPTLTVPVKAPMMLRFGWVI